MIFLKRGVKLLSPDGFGMHPVWRDHALDDIEASYHQCNSPCVITSAWDGKHMKESLHYKGRAFDFRTRTVKKDLRKKLTEVVASLLGDQFDVVFEGDHLHVEYDPR